MNNAWIRVLLSRPARLRRTAGQATQRLLAHFLPVTGMRLTSWPRRAAVTLTLGASLLASGCLHNVKKQPEDLQYADDIEGIRDFRGHVSAIEHPCLDNVTPLEVQVSDEPRNLNRRVDDEVRDITLNEVILQALSKNVIIETAASPFVGGKSVLQAPGGATSIYDPAIQETGILFGRRGLDAALSDFDTQFSTSMIWGRSANRVNTTGAPGISAETGTFASALSKSFATGGSLTLAHEWDYLWSNASGRQFPSAYSGSVGATLRQPLLAGSGVEYSRIAGPVNPAFGAITGVSQGVVIARINQDITLADFEMAVRNSVRDIENAYWDLYLTYRVYDTAVVAHGSAFQTWREAQTRAEVGTLKEADELQARDRLYETKAQVENSLNALYKAESELRRLISLPMNDGTVLRPVDEPMFAEFVPDWKANLTEALSSRTELRRQKWQIKSLQLQLQAARSLVRPRLDAIASYDINGFGDDLLTSSTTDPGTGLPISSGFGSMSRDGLESWTMGFQFSMPIGLRQARSQQRNYELQLAKANALLAQQERNIAHDIATAIQDVTASYEAAQSNAKRLRAANRRVKLLEAEREVGTTTLDLVLRAQSSVAAAESSLYQQVVNYNKAITSLHLATGSLLSQHQIYLKEGPWNPEAMCDAMLRAQERTHGKPNDHLSSEPCEFVSPGFAGTVELQTPASSHSTAAPLPEPIPEIPETTPSDAAGEIVPVPGSELSDRPYDE